jgi:hypothetical protein
MSGELYLSRRAATDAAVKAVNKGWADAFHIQRLRRRNRTDWTFEEGFRAVLFRRRRVIGFA